MIDTVTDTPIGTVYRIVKYDVYATVGTAERHQGRHSERHRTDTEPTPEQQQTTNHNQQASLASEKNPRLEAWVFGMRAVYVGIGGGEPTNPLLLDLELEERERVFLEGVTTAEVESNGIPSSAFLASILRRVLRGDTYTPPDKKLSHAEKFMADLEGV